MANVASTDVTVLTQYREDGPHGNLILVRVLSIVITAAGTRSAGAQIPASALGYTYMTECSNLIKSDNSLLYPAAISSDGLYLLVAGNAGSATATSHGAPAVVTGTFRVTVKGQST